MTDAHPVDPVLVLGGALLGLSLIYLMLVRSLHRQNERRLVFVPAPLRMRDPEELQAFQERVLAFNVKLERRLRQFTPLAITAAVVAIVLVVFRAM